MKILAIDTATEACSVALLNGDEINQEIEIQPTGHSRLVLKMVDKVLVDAGVGLENLDLIAVNNGPGSFTGVRIGLGVTQGLAYGAHLPVVGVCSLEVLAVSIPSGLVMPAIDARMNQIYCSLYSVTDGFRPVQKYSPVVVRPDQIPFVVKEPVFGLGSGWDTYADTITSGIKSNTLQVMKDSYPQAKNLARVARSIGLESTTEPCRLQAHYVRNEIVQKP